MQSDGRDEGRTPQLTHTDPSRRDPPPRPPPYERACRPDPGQASEPEQNHTTSRQGSEPAAAAEAAEQGNAE